MATDKTPKDDLQVDLSLDDLEKERTREPYRTKVEGRVITLNDPQDIDWLDLMNIEDDPTQFVIHCMSDDDADFFMGLRIPAWKVNILMDAFMKHYGLGARGKGRGSRR